MLGINENPVSIKTIENSIIDKVRADGITSINTSDVWTGMKTRGKASSAQWWWVHNAGATSIFVRTCSVI